MLRLFSILALVASVNGGGETVASGDDPTGEVAVALGEGAIDAGLRVVRDPATGRIIDNPTPEQLDRLTEGVEPRHRRSPSDLRRFELAEGGEGVFLDKSMAKDLAVKRNSDGSFGVVCAQGHWHPIPAATENGDKR